MHEKELSEIGNSPHVPREQADEAELLPPGNEVEAEGQEAELHPVEAEPPPPENDNAEAEGHEAELNPVAAESPPPENDDVEAEGHEAELNPVEAEPSPKENDDAEAERHEAEFSPVETESIPPENSGAGKAVEQKPRFDSIEAILSRCRDYDGIQAEGHEAERRPVEAKSSPCKNKGMRKAEKQKAKFHPAEAILRCRRNNDAREAEENELQQTEAILMRPRNDDAREAEWRELNNQIENEFKDSDRGSPLEGAVGGVLNCDRCGDIHFVPCSERPMQPGKVDIFTKFFSNEYDQPMAPILSRQRHSAQMQRPRQRHVSEDSRLSDPNPLGCLQDAGTSGGAVLNQAGAIIGKHIPKEETPDYARFGTEFGQSLPLVPTKDGSERSLGSISTTPIGEIYGGTFSVESDSSFQSFSSRPNTAASDNPETSPPPDSNSPENDKEQLCMAHNSSIAQKTIRKKLAIRKSQQKRSRSALARLSAYAGETQDGELRERELSKDRSVRSEPLHQRKISHSSANSSEPMSLEDETNSTELSHSSESDSYLPGPNIDAAVDSLEENLGSLKISDVESATVVQNVVLEQNEAGESAEQDSTTAMSSSLEVEGSKERESENAEQDSGIAKNSFPEAETSQPQCD